MDLLLFLTSAAHIVYTPFTKVEESFNLQAMHDILYLRHNFTQYDHHEFPGVVPRTFLGPLFISILSTPFILLFETLHINKYWAQYVVRLILAAVVTCGWTKLKRVVTKIYGSDFSLWFSLVTLTQFHFIFYMSRPLPNIMALPIVLYALAYWLDGQVKPFIICSGIAILIFRSELVIFLGLLLLFDLLFKKVTVARILKIAVPAGIVILATSLVVDSFFWQRLLWPEGEVLWYNTILNKSSDWGTSPFLWYFYSALPRAMGASLVFVPIGLLLERRIRPIVIAAIGFVAIYSILPHKELRFIIYIFPVLNLAAAAACQRLWSNSSKSIWHGFLSLCAGGHLFLNVCVTLFLLMISGTNYPGGVALTRLNYLEAASSNVSVHISNLAAQSGVSRFLQIHDEWRYCKNEQMHYTKEESLQYTHLLVESKNKFNNQLWSSLQEDFDTLEFVDCFNSIGIQYNSVIPVKIKTKPCLAILKRKPGRGLVMKDETKKELKQGKKKSIEEDLITQVYEAAQISKDVSEGDKKKNKKKIKATEELRKESGDGKEDKYKKNQRKVVEETEYVVDLKGETNKKDNEKRKSKKFLEDNKDNVELKKFVETPDEERQIETEIIDEKNDFTLVYNKKVKGEKKKIESLNVEEDEEDTEEEDEEHIERSKEKRHKLEQSAIIESTEAKEFEDEISNEDDVSLQGEKSDKTKKNDEIPLKEENDFPEQGFQQEAETILEEPFGVYNKDESEEDGHRDRERAECQNDTPQGAAVFEDSEEELVQNENPLLSKTKATEDLSTLAASLEDDAIVSTVESYEDLPYSEELLDTGAPVHKEINFQELRNLALGQVNRKTKATKLKIRRLIEQHFRSKGKHIEDDSVEKKDQKLDKPITATSTRQSVKAIIKQERIKEMIEQIATMDLTRVCNLEKVSTKDCLKSVIDKIDAEDKTHHHS